MSGASAPAIGLARESFREAEAAVFDRLIPRVAEMFDQAGRDVSPARRNECEFGHDGCAAATNTTPNARGMDWNTPTATPIRGRLPRLAA
jgi:hypothetical protein